MANSAPTIVSIAQQLKLSTSTVSEVLRGKPGYNEATRQRVLSTAKRQGYRPNYLSRALVGSKSKTIGISAALTETPAVAMMVSNIELAARRHGYLCYFLDSGFVADEDQLASHLQNILDRRVDALIVHQNTDLFPAAEQILANCDVPVVRLGKFVSTAHRGVRIDRVEAFTNLARHLAELGHRRAAVVLSAYGHRHPEEKLTPLRQAMSSFDIQLDCSPRWISEPGFDYNYGCLKMLQREIPRGHLPTAMIFSSDRYAVEAYAVLHDLGLKIPDDISVVGFDDDHYARVLRPALTTIRQPGAEVGLAAFDMLLQLMEDPEATVENQNFQCELIIRNSTGLAKNP